MVTWRWIQILATRTPQNPGTAEQRQPRDNRFSSINLGFTVCIITTVDIHSGTDCLHSELLESLHLSDFNFTLYYMGASLIWVSTTTPHYTTPPRNPTLPPHPYRTPPPHLSSVECARTEQSGGSQATVSWTVYLELSVTFCLHDKDSMMLQGYTSSQSVFCTPMPSPTAPNPLPYPMQSHSLSVFPFPCHGPLLFGFLLSNSQATPALLTFDFTIETLTSSS